MLFANLEQELADDRAEVVITRYLSAANCDSFEGGCPLPSTVGEVATTAAEHRDVLAQIVTALTRRFEAQLTAANALAKTHGLPRNAFTPKADAGESVTSKPVLRRGDSSPTRLRSGAGRPAFRCRS